MELSTDFQRYRSVILDLESRYQKFRSNITVQVQKIIPKLRSGIENQIELTKIIEGYRTSPWEKETFLTLLNTRKKEIGKTIFEKPPYCEIALFVFALLDNSHCHNFAFFLIETTQEIIYHSSLQSKLNKNVFINFDHTGDLTKCIINNNYALAYQLEVLPESANDIGMYYVHRVIVQQFLD